VVGWGEVPQGAWLSGGASSGGGLWRWWAGADEAALGRKKKVPVAAAWPAPAGGPLRRYYYYYYRCALAVAEAMGSRAISGGSCANATTTNIGSSQLLPRPLLTGGGKTGSTHSQLQLGLLTTCPQQGVKPLLPAERRPRAVLRRSHQCAEVIQEWLPLGVEGWALQGEVCGCLVIAAATKYTCWAGLVFLGGSVGHWGEPCSVEHLELGAPVRCSVQDVADSFDLFV
jgi:hypothetical protein